MPGGERRQGIARYAAPAAFLLAVTIAVLLIRSGLGGHGTTSTPPPTTAPPAATTTQRTTTTASTTSGTTANGANYYVVQKGDTFGAIAVKENTTIAEIQRLNPGVSSNALQVGQKIRVR